MLLSELAEISQTTLDEYGYLAVATLERLEARDPDLLNMFTVNSENGRAQCY